MCINPHVPLRISTIPLDGHVTDTHSWAERAGFMGLCWMTLALVWFHRHVDLDGILTYSQKKKVH